MAEIKSLFDIVTTREIKDYIDRSEVIKNKKPHLLEKFFPIQDTRSLTIEWLKEKVRLDRVLNASTFDSDVPLRGYNGIESAKTQMAYFNEGQLVGENDLEKLNDMMQMNPTSPSVRAFIDKTFRKFTSLVNGAYDTPEYMRASLITEARITVKQANEYGGATLYTYNFDQNGQWANSNNFTLVGNDAWSDVNNSNPIQDIINMADRASQKGLRIAAMVMGSTTYNQFKNNGRIKQQLTTVLNPLGFVTPDILRQLVTGVVGYDIEIIIDDESFMGTDDMPAFYYPQTGCVSFICVPVLGTTYFGLTPEEIAKNAPSSEHLDVLRLERGIVISTEWKKKPVQKTMITSLITLPSYEMMDAVFNLKWDDTVTQYSLVYNSNGGSGDAPTTETKKAGATTTIAAGTGLTKDSKAFLRWNDEADGTGRDYPVGSTYTFNGNKVLYAIYAE